MQGPQDAPAHDRPPAYPDAARLDLVEDLHGHRVADPYRWLEDAGCEDTASWSAAQDALFAEHRDTWPGRERVRDRLTALLAAGVVSAPAWRGERRFFLRRTAEQEHAVLLTVDPDGTERVLLDPVARDPSGTTTLDGWQPSKEGDRLAYQLSTGGDEESHVSVMDVATGEDVDGPLDRTRYSPVAWLPGGEAFYYVRRLPADEVPDGEEQYHRRVWLHRVGTDPSTDARVFGDGMERTNYYGAAVSRDGRWLLVSAAAGTAPRNDVWIADLEHGDPAAPAFVPVQTGVDARTGPHVGRDGRLYVVTDLDAPRGRLVVTDPATPGPEHWRDLVPEDAEAVLEDVAILDAGLERPVLLVSRTRHTVAEVAVHDLATGARLGDVPLPGLGTIGGLSERPEGGHEVWFGYTDHVTPPSVYRYDAVTGETTLWASPPGDVAVPDVHARQVTYASADGTEVRMFLVSAEAAPDGPRPTVLYGYGGFGLPLTPAYSASILAWVEAGGVWAVANLRGGGEEGEEWHRAGMRERKQNVFDDFAAAAQWLVDHGWTTPDRLAASGGSNGGLLVGAALTQRPDLFAAVSCSAPLLDMVRYERFGLGETWNDEYGRADDPTELAWLLGYSPYHHVTEDVAYPAVLFTVFESDTRVDPMHARKMCAALQSATASPRPVLYRRETEVGHGARALSRTVALTVDTTAFLAAQTGLDLPGGAATGPG
jgi:prolyl oligopeptidase